MTHAQDVRDVIVVGSGPAGHLAAVHAARADLRPIVFAGSVTAGGALRNTTEPVATATTAPARAVPA